MYVLLVPACLLLTKCCSDYWGYFEPIRQYMPQNCSADVQAVIAYIDKTFQSGNEKEIKAIEKTFNMTLSHLDDFAGACMSLSVFGLPEF